MKTTVLLLSILSFLCFGFGVNSASRITKYKIHFTEPVRIVDIADPLNVLVQEGLVTFKVYKGDAPLHVLITNKQSNTSNIIMCYEKNGNKELMYSFVDLVLCN